MNKLSDISSTELLRELLRRSPPGQGPSRSDYADTIRETSVGIGNDHMATIRLHVDDIEALEQISGESQAA